jgi:hypothetical protein
MQVNHNLDFPRFLISSCLFSLFFVWFWFSSKLFLFALALFCFSLIKPYIICAVGVINSNVGERRIINDELIISMLVNNDSYTW